MNESEKPVTKEEYPVEGMTCSGCERTVQKVITNLQGVKSAKTDVASGTVVVEFDPSQINADAIKSAVSKVGYKLLP